MELVPSHRDLENRCDLQWLLTILAGLWLRHRFGDKLINKRVATVAQNHGGQFLLISLSPNLCLSHELAQIATLWVKVHSFMYIDMYRLCTVSLPPFHSQQIIYRSIYGPVNGSL